MRWGKIVLLFQAFITLILGIAFFTQVINIDANKISETGNSINASSPPQPMDITNIKTRYSSASYILLFVSLIELIIITRLLT